MRRWHPLCLIAVFAVAVVATSSHLGCGLGTPNSEALNEIQLTILHTNDANGYVEPCG